MSNAVIRDEDTYVTVLPECNFVLQETDKLETIKKTQLHLNIFSDPTSETFIIPSMVKSKIAARRATRPINIHLPFNLVRGNRGCEILLHALNYYALAIIRRTDVRPRKFSKG